MTFKFQTFFIVIMFKGDVHLIYTVTFNPSIDYIVSMNDFSFGKTNRTTEEKMLPGGKGINVSTVLTNLGISNIALGFIAGFTGNEIKRLCVEKKILCDFISLSEGSNRINIKLKNYDGTEINGCGPVIPSTKLEELFVRLQQLNAGDTLVLAGSIPASLPSDIYQTIIKNLIHKKIHIVIDATKELLLNCLPYRPFLIKPNKHEIEELFDIIIKDKTEAIHYAGQLQHLGARNVMVSLGADGAVFVSEEGNSFEANAPKGTLINAVGAGDSMIAGFLAGWETTLNYKEAFLMAVAAGSASAYSEELATKEDILNLHSLITK